MEQYIPKAAVVAEINKRLHQLTDAAFDSMIGRNLIEIRDSLDTLEVKEVDLEKIIDDYFKDWKFDDELDIMIKPNNYSASFTDLKEIAKHFFELGLKAQKGE